MGSGCIEEGLDESLPVKNSIAVEALNVLFCYGSHLEAVSLLASLRVS